MCFSTQTNPVMTNSQDGITLNMVGTPRLTVKNNFIVQNKKL